MSTKVLVVYYSSFGHVYQLARCVEEGAQRSLTWRLAFAAFRS